MAWSSSITPLNPAFNGIKGWIDTKEAGFKAGFKKHALSRVVTPLAVIALGSVSFVYNAGSFVLKSPVTLTKYTFLMIIPVKVNGKWCAAGSCVSDSFGAKEMCKHGIKAVAFLVEVVVCPALAVASPSFVIWLHVKAGLVDLTPWQKMPVAPVNQDDANQSAGTSPNAPVVDENRHLFGDELSRRLAQEAKRKKQQLHHLVPNSALSSFAIDSDDSDVEEGGFETDESVGSVESDSDDEESAFVVQDERDVQYSLNMNILRDQLLRKRGSLVGLTPSSGKKRPLDVAENTSVRTLHPQKRFRLKSKRPNNKALLQNCNLHKGEVSSDLLAAIRDPNRKPLKRVDPALVNGRKPVVTSIRPLEKAIDDFINRGSNHGGSSVADVAQEDDGWDD